jgi:hypothetical protein
MAEINPNDAKQQDAHAAQMREKALRDRTVPAIQSWPVDPETGKPMTVVVAMASDLVPTVPFGNVTIQATIMRPVPTDRALTPEELTQDIASARDVQKAAEYVVGTERRLLQWALDPASRVQHPVTGTDFTGQNEAMGQPPAGAQVSTPPAPAPVAGAPAGDGYGGAQVG